MKLNKLGQAEIRKAEFLAVGKVFRSIYTLECKEEYR